MKLFVSSLLLMTVFVFSAFAQESKKAIKPTELDKTAAIPTDGFLKRGVAIGMGDKVSLGKVMKDPSKYGEKLILVEGVVVRSCKTEGCWAEVAEKKEGKSIRIKMKDHSFFIPLQSEGAWARVEGTVKVKTLSKEEVDHMIADDGAKFPDRNADGTVTEITFEATGIELTRAVK